MLVMDVGDVTIFKSPTSPCHQPYCHQFLHIWQSFIIKRFIETSFLVLQQAKIKTQRFFHRNLHQRKARRRYVFAILYLHHKFELLVKHFLGDKKGRKKGKTSSQVADDKAHEYYSFYCFSR